MPNILAYTAVKQGKSILLSCSDGQEALITNWSDAISFLLKPCDMALVWNIDAFVSTVASIFPLQFQTEIKEKDKVFAPDRTKSFYNAGRMLSITYGSQETNFFSLHRYSETEIKTAKELEAFGYEVLKAYKELGITPTKLASPVSCYPLDKVPYPRASDLPSEALPLLNACHKTMSREWRDVFKLGHWNANEVSDVDIQSSYPSIMAELPDMTNATFFESDTIPINTINSGYSWGELTGKIKIVKDVSPFVNEGAGEYRKGEWSDSITTDQLWLLKRWGIGEFQMEHGYFFYNGKPNPHPYPFKATMENLYKARSISNPIAANIAKAISVGIGGKLAQSYENNGVTKLGNDYNSIYARMTTSRCMVKLCDFVYRNHLQDKLISALVDGCLVQAESLAIAPVKKMGAWKQNEPSPFLVASLLFEWGADKKPNGKTYSEMMSLIKKNPGSSEYSGVDLNL